MIWFLSLFPERWLEKALRRKPNIFSVMIIRGDELAEMAKAANVLERHDDAYLH